ncbi:MAG: hypothetical protein BEN19_04685 [Epulopiscium sp. Nuni2H_MBin003]|nr:MAG: hypothetical protein BEN19_04685 [Epulopiscium sp. Nuni2H_MBin003]
MNIWVILIWVMALLQERVFSKTLFKIGILENYKFAISAFRLINILIIISRLLMITSDTSTSTCIAIIIIFILEILLFRYANKLLRVTCGMIIPFHCLIMNIVISGSLGTTMHQGLQYLTHNYTFLLIVEISILIFASLFILLIIYNVYMEVTGKEININKFTSWAIIPIVVLLGVNYGVSHIDMLVLSAVITDTILGAVTLCLFQVVILFIIGIDVYFEYKFKTEKIGLLDGIYKSMLAHKEDVVMEIDSVSGLLTNAIELGEVQKNIIGQKYNRVANAIIRNRVYAEDKEIVSKIATLDTLLEFIKEDKNSLELRLKKGSEYEWCLIEVLKEQTKQETRIILTCNSIQATKDLVFKTKMDALSNLYNKATTETLIQQHLQIHASGILFMIDVDNFKGVNDYLGHDMGDYVIKDVADKLKHLFRVEDIVGRIGGDEFMVFIKHNIDIENRANTICNLIRNIYSKDDIEVEISASIGIAQANNNCTSFSELYKAADKAMYVSKQNGKNTFTVYKEDMADIVPIIIGR